MTSRALILIMFYLCMCFPEVALGAHAKSDSVDPFNEIKKLILQNGIVVYLAHSESKTATIEIDIGVGWKDENAHNAGIAHLLEHLVFRNEGYSDSTNELEIVENAGGIANANTSRSHTTYLGAIETNKYEWLLDSFRMMIFKPQFSEKTLKDEVESIATEIADTRSGTSDLAHIWQSEFGIVIGKQVQPSNEIHNISKMTISDLTQYYQKFYQPDNLTLFIASNITAEKTANYLQATWGQIPGHFKKDSAQIAKAKEPQGLIRRTLSGNTTGEAFTGIKTQFQTLAECEIVLSYNSYLSTRLYHEFKKSNRGSYRADSDVSLIDRLGIIGIRFDISNENADMKIANVDSLLNHEAVQGELTNEQIYEAKQSYLKKYELMNRTNNRLISLARTLHENQINFGEARSPYSVLAGTTPEEYREVLSKLFAQENRFQSVKIPAIFFHGDLIVFIVLSSIAAFFWAKLLPFKKTFSESVIWTSSQARSRFKMVEMTLIAISSTASLSSIYALHQTLAQWQKFYVNSAILDYFFWTSTPILIAISIVVSCSIIVKKVSITAENLIVESFTRRRLTIALVDIASVEAQSFWARSTLGNIFSFRCARPLLSVFSEETCLIIKTTSGSSFIVGANSKVILDLIKPKPDSHTAKTQAS